MRIVIVYGSTEGQTRKIARFAQEHLAAAGHSVEVFDASGQQPEFELPPCDRAIVAASLHAGRYQAAIEHFARNNHARLNAMDAAFLSVSLAAAGDDEEDRRGLAECVERFTKETRWQPGVVWHVAGAFRFTHYDFMKRWAMKYIAWRKGQPTDTSQDYEYTDWDALILLLNRFTR